MFICYVRFINIEPSAVDEERDTANPSNEENHENLTLKEQDIMGNVIVSGETQNPDLSTTNTTMNSPLSTKFWNGLNIAEKTVSV